MNHGALVLLACLAWPTFYAAAQNPLQNSALRKLEIAVRLDDAPEHQRIRTMEGSHATLFASPPRPVQTPMGVVPQEVTVQEQAATFGVIPRVVAGRVQVEIAHRAGASSANGKLGEWFDLGAIATAEGTRRMRIRVDEIP
jgi:hypothetical protein